MSTLGLMMVDLEVIKISTEVAPVPEWMQDIHRSEIMRKTSFWSVVFVAVVVGPLGEELLFRGIILSGLLAYYKRTYAIVWSAVLFGIMHMDPWKFTPIFISGVVWGWWVVRTQSLLPALSAHMLCNFVPTAAGHLHAPTRTVSESLDDLAFLPWFWSLAGMALTALGLWWFYRVSNETQLISGTEH